MNIDVAVAVDGDFRAVIAEVPGLFPVGRAEVRTRKLIVSPGLIPCGRGEAGSMDGGIARDARDRHIDKRKVIVHEARGSPVILRISL